MKKILIIVFTVCLIACNLFSSYAQDQSLITEDDLVKVLIDGKYIKFVHKPIIVDYATLFPLYETLKALGVQNDESHIIWNSADKSITVKKNDLVITFYIGSTKAMINGKESSISNAPVQYKSQIYIPIRFIAESFGKEVIWDESISTMVICDGNEHDKMKEICSKVEAAMMNIKKFKRVVTSTSIDKQGRKFSIIYYLEYDYLKKKKYWRSDSGSIIMEEYDIGDMNYSRQINFTKRMKWSKEKSETDYRSGIRYFGNSFIEALNLKDNIMENEYILEGCTIENANEFVELIKRTNVVYTKIFIDKDTFLVKEDYSRLITQVPVNYRLHKCESSTRYFDMNGDFEIEIPSDLKH